MAWVLDLDGVVWLGEEPIEGSAEAVRLLRGAGEAVVFATNNASSRVADQEEKLASMGIEPMGSVVTAAQAGAAMVEAGERVLVLGGPGLHEEIRRRGAEVVGSGPCDVVVSGLDRKLTYDSLRHAVLAINRGARWILTNSDPTYPTPRGLEPGGGTIGAAIAAATGVEPVVAGKPNGTMVDLLRSRLGESGVVVGDRPDTDGLFAQALGYRFALAFSGVTRPEDLPVHPEPWCTGRTLAEIVNRTLQDGR